MKVEILRTPQAEDWLRCKRLCAQASAETRQIMQEIVRKVETECPEFIDLLKKPCEKYGKCFEFFKCNG